MCDSSNRSRLTAITHQTYVQVGCVFGGSTRTRPSPRRRQADTSGHRSAARTNPFYEFMREVAPGDLVLSFEGTHIRAIGVARSCAYECPKPPEFGSSWPELEPDRVEGRRRLPDAREPDTTGGSHAESSASPPGKVLASPCGRSGYAERVSHRGTARPHARHLQLIGGDARILLDAPPVAPRRHRAESRPSRMGGASPSRSRS